MQLAVGGKVQYIMPVSPHIHPANTLNIKKKTIMYSGDLLKCDNNSTMTPDM